MHPFFGSGGGAISCRMASKTAWKWASYFFFRASSMCESERIAAGPQSQFFRQPCRELGQADSPPHQRFVVDHASSPDGNP
jgi:hypothetical protein